MFFATRGLKALIALLFVLVIVIVALILFFQFLIFILPLVLIVILLGYFFRMLNRFKKKPKDDVLEVKYKVKK
ncbi:MAG TPA: hypothetical protein VJI15_06330 [Candidatus Nanoarchaeia archaeon]|nr:hypothetical protein [Candidatus Nanoarchaeia archaeon]